MTQPPPSAPTLFAAVGGAAAVSRVVEGFYRRVESEPELRAIYPEDLEPGKAKLKLFFEQWLGGPETYSQLYGHPRLRRRHFPFVIDERAAGRWLRHMGEAMTEEGVPAETRRVIFEALAPLAHHMVNAGQAIPRTPFSG